MLIIVDYLYLLLVQGGQVSASIAECPLIASTSPGHGPSGGANPACWILTWLAWLASKVCTM
jgi:hypothetical protein